MDYAFVHEVLNFSIVGENGRYQVAGSPEETKNISDEPQKYLD